MITNLVRIIYAKISFSKEQIIHNVNKREVNKKFQTLLDIIRSTYNSDPEQLESTILQKKVLLINNEYVHKSDRVVSKLDGLAWLQRLMGVDTTEEKEHADTKDMIATNSTFLSIKELLSYYVCYRGVSKPAEHYYIQISGQNPKSPTPINPLAMFDINSSKRTITQGETT
jgi:hypothetical protein